MTREEKQKAIDALKISAPIMVMTQEKFNDYIQILNKVMDWLEQEPITKNNLGVDCISRTRAIERLKLNFPISDGADNSRDRHRYMQALADIQAIREMPSVTPQEPKFVPIAEFKYDKDKLKELVDEAVLTVTSQEPRWIPVSERLPEEKVNPITMDFYEYPCTVKFDDVYDVRYYKFGRGKWWHGAGTIDNEVIAWQPLPEPYKMESEDKET